VIVHGTWNTLTEVLQKTFDIEEVFQLHEDSLDAGMKDFFLTDAKSIADACRQFTIELNKWKKAVDRPGVTPELKMRHEKPMRTFSEAFEKKIQQLIQTLITLANREVNQMYADFVPWININNVYVHYVNPRSKA
jgi:hypothetical protein